MKVKMLKENKVVEVNDSYGLRLITQGMAVAAADDEAKSTTKKKVGTTGDK